MFLFDDGLCVYPAENLQKFTDNIETLKAEKSFYQEIKEGRKEYIILRNQNDLIQTDNKSKFTTFWGPLKDNAGNITGTIGLQIDQ